MTALVDVNNAPGDLTALKKDLTEATAPVEQVEKPAPEPEVPEKYQGKSVEDVIDMHRNAESALGRSSNELGQYKQLTDRLLELKRPSDLQKGGASEADIDEPQIEVSSTDLLDNPTEAISRVVEARLTKDARKRQAKKDEDALTAAQADFATRHPDAGEIAQKDEFRKWVNDSPTRLRAAKEAYNKDFQAGTDLLDEWKASHADTSETEEDVTEAALKEAKKASTVTTGASQTGDIPTGKTYRRLDLIRLKLEDPEAYGDESFQREIMKAYHEGRVK